ncbi:uncharacterized protein LOC131847903 [Achroia grisella]|uniref:uncharacterized protein LOC131847903 n=1 Tax=Achroia grisella TaxID=688607 RepID=UPI0027D2A592|nr:uncharacterized protein LOC131847903 [Achroia grisella]
MNNLKKISVSKVTPIQVVPSKETQILPKESQSYAYRMNYIIIVQAVLGFNRLYLLKYGKVRLWLSYVYSIFLMACILAFAILRRSTATSSYLVIQSTTCIEFLLLVFITMTSKKKTLESFFENLNKFDEKLNIKDCSIIVSNSRIFIWILICILYSIIEYLLLMFYLNSEYDYFSVLIYLSRIAHDLEQVFFCTLLRSIYLRVRVIKGHISKTFEEKYINDEQKPFEALSNNTKLDISSMHRMYELLHKCAEQLNSTMSLPMIISLFCSGLSTTMLLRILFKTLQIDSSDNNTKDATVIYISARCLKYTLLVIFPCYYSSITTTQVANIRTMLHDAMNGAQLEKIDRRRVKAFFQLTRESEFAYALWGVIRLNMSLPLSYTSLCTTYLVIIIQFSKFID